MPTRAQPGPSFAMLDECLVNGRWTHAPVDFTGYCREPAPNAIDGNATCAFRCPHMGSRALSVWTGPACERMLQVGPNASFNFAQATKVFTLGDSVSGQIARMMQWAARRNSRLSNLHVTSCAMGIIPRRSATIEAALHECLGSPKGRTPASRRAIIVNLGLWYHPTPWCAPSRKAGSASNRYSHRESVGVVGCVWHLYCDRENIYIPYYERIVRA